MNYLKTTEENSSTCHNKNGPYTNN